MNNYDFVANMTTTEFVEWFDDLYLSEKFEYYIFLFKHLVENDGEKIEYVNGEKWQCFLNIHTVYDIIESYCRVKPQTKTLKYKPYEKADPKWLLETSKVLYSKIGKTYMRINAVDPNNKEKAIYCKEYWYSLDMLFNGFEWYDVETGERTPFGETFYE